MKPADQDPHFFHQHYIYIFEAIHNESYFFANVHSFMNYTNLTDNCQAHLPVHYASNIKLIRQKWH